MGKKSAENKKKREKSKELDEMLQVIGRTARNKIKILILGLKIFTKSVLFDRRFLFTLHKDLRKSQFYVNWNWSVQEENLAKIGNASNLWLWRFVFLKCNHWSLQWKQKTLNSKKKQTKWEFFWCLNREKIQFLQARADHIAQLANTADALSREIAQDIEQLMADKGMGTYWINRQETDFLPNK